VTNQYLKDIRKATAYPILRGFATFFAIVGYLLAALIAVVGFLTGEFPITLAACAGAVVVVLLAKLGKESALLLADLADATLDIGARTRQEVAAEYTGRPTVQANLSQASTRADSNQTIACSKCGFENDKLAYKCSKCTAALI
jgi:hypothetical protein